MENMVGTPKIIREPMSDEERLKLLNDTLENLTNTLLATERSSDCTQPHGYLIKDAKKREMIKDSIDACVRTIYGILTPSGVYIYEPGTMDTLENQLRDSFKNRLTSLNVKDFVKNVRFRPKDQYYWFRLVPHGNEYWQINESGFSCLDDKFFTETQIIEIQHGVDEFYEWQPMSNKQVD